MAEIPQTPKRTFVLFMSSRCQHSQKLLSKIKEKFNNNNKIRFISLLILALTISFFGTFDEVPFIYFQF